MKKNNLEMIVGLFMLAGLLAFGYLALQLGEVSILSSSSKYVIKAEFDNVSGVKKGAAVQIAGVVVGDDNALNALVPIVLQPLAWRDGFVAPVVQ